MQHGGAQALNLVPIIKLQEIFAKKIGFAILHVILTHVQ